MRQCADALLAEGWTPPVSSSGGEGSSNVRMNSPLYKGKKNRLDSDGKPMKCFHCQSEYHLSYQCDQKNNQSSDQATVSKGKAKQKKANEQTTMLSTLLSANAQKYAMVCDSHEVACEKGDGVRTLSELLLEV